MSIKSEGTFSVGETSLLMDPRVKDTLNALIARMDQMNRRLQEFKDQADANCKDLVTRLDRLEIIRRRTAEKNVLRDNSRSPWCR